MIIIGRTYESKLKNSNHTKQIEHLMISNNFCFRDRSILLQDVSLEYDISHWNKTKQTICISKKYSCFTRNCRNNVNIDSLSDNATGKINNILGVTTRFLQSFLGS